MHYDDDDNYTAVLWTMFVLVYVMKDFVTPFWVELNRIIKQLVSVDIDKDCLYWF